MGERLAEAPIGGKCKGVDLLGHCGAPAPSPARLVWPSVRFDRDPYGA